MGATVTTTTTGFVLAQIWGLIQAVPPPGAVNLPAPSILNVKGRPLPGSIPGQGTIIFYRFVAVGIAIAIFAAAPGAWILAVLALWVGLTLAGGAGASERAAEATKRRTALRDAQCVYDQLVERARNEAGPAGFLARRAELGKLRDELQELPKVEKQEIDKLHMSAHERQKQKFLDTCFIDRANIAGLGPSRKAALRSFGIETAADVTRSRVMQGRFCTPRVAPGSNGRLT
jgi:DNA-binding helix-hairpin-helix protein with protein kinase domain